MSVFELKPNWAILSKLDEAARISAPMNRATHPANVKPSQRRKLYRGRDVLSRKRTK